jgi:hypothetical protein
MFGVYEIRMGAIYKFASSRQLSRHETSALLVERTGMKLDSAKQLVGHWFTTYIFRRCTT